MYISIPILIVVFAWLAASHEEKNSFVCSVFSFVGFCCKLIATGFLFAAVLAVFIVLVFTFLALFPSFSAVPAEMLKKGLTAIWGLNSEGEANDQTK